MGFSCNLDGYFAKKISKSAFKLTDFYMLQKLNTPYPLEYRDRGYFFSVGFLPTEKI